MTFAAWNGGREAAYETFAALHAHHWRVDAVHIRVHHLLVCLDGAKSIEPLDRYVLQYPSHSRARDRARGRYLRPYGRILATTDEEGNRIYNDDKRTRRAVSQTVGDTLSMSGTGVESFHAATLLGLSGESVFDTLFNANPSNQGNSLRLTIHAELSRYIHKQFPDGYDGAVSLINYKTGEILAMVSMPYYDPEELENRSQAAEASGSGYLNRNTQGQYTPGSVFKIVTLASALEYLPGVEERTFECNGEWAYEGGSVTCAGGAVHGTMTLEEAFAESCNIVFAKLAYELGAQRLLSTAEAFGFNDVFQFQDLIVYDSSIDTQMPTVGDLAWTGVGQGKTLVTPLHMALIAASVANDG